MRVLLVDDAPEVRGQLRRLLSRDEAVERVFESGEVEEGLGKARELAPDLVVADLQLGASESDGLELIRKLKREELGSSVVVFSNHPELEEYALTAGADAFFDKSDGVEGLLEFVRSVAGPAP